MSKIVETFSFPLVTSLMRFFERAGFNEPLSFLYYDLPIGLLYYGTNKQYDLFFVRSY